MSAKLVFDGAGPVYIPEEMGSPRSDQMRGQPLEQLCELAGRVCYDSLGNGRPSFDGYKLSESGGPSLNIQTEGYHTHIEKCGHGSVLEHAQITINVPVYNGKDHRPNMLHEIEWRRVLENRPGIYLTMVVPYELRVTFNPRVVRDWDVVSKRFKHHTRLSFALQEIRIHQILQNAVNGCMPRVFSMPQVDPFGDIWSYVPASLPEEKWVTLWMQGSRGFSHEQVRHKFRTAVSQRSTRYVDETESPWLWHPALASGSDGMMPDAVFETIKAAMTAGRTAYVAVVNALQGRLSHRGVDKATARKQARGAARGYLGNALETQMLFSASMPQWLEMLRQRLSPGADAEIRAVYRDVYSELLKSRYADMLSDIRLKPSPDGIGEVLA